MPFGVPDFHAFHIEQGLAHYYQNDFDTALVEFDQALAIRESDMARFDRAHALLALGRYGEAWPDYASRYRLYGNSLSLTDRGLAVRRRLPHWNGEDAGRLVVLSEGGFGDTVMLLRFIAPLLNRFDQLEVVLEVPEPLCELAAQCAPLGDDGDMWCSLFDLPAVFHPILPVPPYLRPNVARVARWREQLVGLDDAPRNIGIAWSSDTGHAGEHENGTRSLPLELFLELLPIAGELYSLQEHDRDDAVRLGVRAPGLRDFADVAALTAQMDAVVSIDTAALHVAGAIGHGNIYALLPWAPTWRWHAGNRWYPQIKLCRAEAAGDWSSAFEKILEEAAS